MDKEAEAKTETAAGPASSSNRNIANQIKTETQAGITEKLKGICLNEVNNKSSVIGQPAMMTTPLADIKTSSNVSLRIPIDVITLKYEGVESELFYVSSLPFKLVTSMEEEVLFVRMICECEDMGVLLFNVEVRITAKPYDSEDCLFEKWRILIFRQSRKEHEFKIEISQSKVLQTDFFIFVNIAEYTKLKLNIPICPHSFLVTTPTNFDDWTRKYIVFSLEFITKRLLNFAWLESEMFYVDSKRWHIILIYENNCVHINTRCFEKANLLPCRADVTITIVDTDTNNNIRKKFSHMYSENDRYHLITLVENFKEHPVYGQREVISLQMEVVVKNRGPVPVEYLPVQ